MAEDAPGKDRDPCKRVLIVDEDRRFQQVLHLVLRDNGYSVADSGDYISASQQVLREGYDAFIIDYGMDGKYAPAFVRFLRQRFPESVIVAMSGHHDGSDFAGTGADLFLTKPVEFGRLLRMLDGR